MHLRATYRVQLHAGFTFDDAAAQADYLAALGVSHLYCSPYLQAAPGSTHGYDVVDHSRANAELGGEDGRRRLVDALRAHDLGSVLDIVPNHMSVAAGQANAWWWDVLEHGSASPWTGYFDIDYDVAHARRLDERGRILIPVLGEDGLSSLRLEADGERWLLAYHDHRYPVADGTAAEGDDPRDVHERQHYVLVDWRRASEQLNYRRFFDVSELASVRVEDSRVFEDTHGVVLSWVADGSLDGLRIDHPDGLADPAGYLQRLRDRAPDAWIVVEKILEPEEALPADWPVAGTTGYDAMREVTGLFVDPAGEEPLTRLYAELTGETTDWPELVHDRKLAAATGVLHAEILRLTSLVERMGRTDTELGRLDRSDVAAALAELAACLPVYRTYLRALYPSDSQQVDILERAAADATRRRPDLADVLATLVRLLVSPTPGLGADLATRFQQTSGMVMAKGVEDTAFYRFHRLVALNEVGGDPGRFGVGLDEFHERCAARARDWPSAMTALTTHDTKRSEDVRARLALLSEMPDEWGAAVQRWFAATREHRDGSPVDDNICYLLWQTLVGAWPISRDRLGAYLEKASREAKQHTSWVERADDYDKSLQQLVDAVYADPDLMADVAAFVQRLEPAWQVTAVAQKLVQLTMPGIPDVYQGSELWTLSLVDPDNRRPVDFAALREALSEAASLEPEALWARAAEGLPKLAVTRAALRLRGARPEAFGPEGGYEPLRASGSRSAHVVAFVRGADVVTVAPRLVVTLADDWGDTTLDLPPGTWRHEITGEEHAGGSRPIADLLARLPVALLSRVSG